MRSLIERVFTPFTTGRGDVGLLFLRIIAGWAFMLHGWRKIHHPFSWMGPDTSMPSIFQALAAISEFGGGLAWILGILTPLASFGILCTMMVAVWIHYSGGAAFVNGDSTFELPLVYFAVAFTLMLVGPGVFSVDAVVFGTARRADRL